MTEESLDAEATTRELITDAGRIGGLYREYHSVKFQLEVLGDKMYEEMGPLADGEDSDHREITIRRRIRDERPDLSERLRFLIGEIDAIMARARLLEVAVVADKVFVVG